ncbi:penicillin-binding protein 1C [Dethiosulfatarculus sandiegensis]|uniref:peptidoglycan glycosyltransferase n=1 Tax=Dethiosulfatarculus sandiegensis TaxID=1429043 RepID=A0A0D2JCY8_9BACT|nr:penicillin-binding protein 1C [Dethiosulfatarculus sandiegensis]KIX13621.1 penicillin-binding protein 1C [Dethiosulfatarculus sandiegensis]
MKKSLLTGLGLLALSPLLLWIVCVSLPGHLPQEGYGRVKDSIVLAQNGQILTRLKSRQLRAGPWLGKGEIPPLLEQAALAAEDKRFYLHPGVDPMALVRAMVQNLLANKVVSGGSTLTMQLARLLNPGPRTLQKKFKEIKTALWLEARLDKKAILRQYLNRAPFGGPLQGLAAASRELLGKNQHNLAPHEAALLLALVKDPSRLIRPENRNRLRKRRNHILKKMAQNKAISPDALAEALKMPVVFHKYYDPNPAPHFTRHLNTFFKGTRPPVIKTYIDLVLQRKMLHLAREACTKNQARGVRQAAVLVIDNNDLSIKAWVGSPDFSDPDAGQVDGVLARRQPGSTLKPFLYALALTKGHTLAETIKDEPLGLIVSGGVFRPVDYDQRHRGPVRLRVALASSLNLPALRLADSVGVEPFLRTLRQLGFKLPRQADHYGLGLALGNGEVTLLELTQAYATMANMGKKGRAGLWQGQAGQNLIPVLDPYACRLVADALADDWARAPGFGRHSLLELPFEAAVKTGTSQKYRDNWCVGFTGSYTVGVWVGNFQGKGMQGVSGITGAAPLWRQAMLYLHKDKPGKLPPWPQGVERVAIDPHTGKLPGPDTLATIQEYFSPGTVPQPDQENLEKPVNPLKLLAPFDGAVYALDPDMPLLLQVLNCKAKCSREVTQSKWLLDGAPLTPERSLLEARLALKPGLHTVLLEVKGPWGEASQKAGFRVMP